MKKKALENLLQNFALCIRPDNAGAPLRSCSSDRIQSTITRRLTGNNFPLSRDTCTTQGSITLESAIISPAIFAVLLLLINFVRLGTVYLAVDHAVGETAKQVAAHTYPLLYLEKGSRNIMEKLSLPGDGWNMWETEIARGLLAEAAGIGLDAALKRYVEKKLPDYLIPGIINPEDIKITSVKMCNPWASPKKAGLSDRKGLDSKDIMLEVEYKIPIWAPLMGGREVTMVNTAVERAWLDDV